MTKIPTPIDGNELIQGHSKKLLNFATILLLASVILLWGCNTIATDLAGLPRAQFKHAAAAVLSLSCLTWMVGHILRLASRN